MNSQKNWNAPYFCGREMEYIQDAVNRNKIDAGGEFTQKCVDVLQKDFYPSNLFLTKSGTAALEIAAMLIDANDNDEIIIPAYTFVSTVNAFYLRGAKPVFVDIRPDTLNIDEKLIESKITSKTKAIVPVHYAGIACNMSEISRLASKYGIRIVEDNAQGIGATYQGKQLGTFGDVSILSFHQTKNIHCGEGGCLIVNDKQLVGIAEIYLDHGTNKREFKRGNSRSYEWVDKGSNYGLSEILAAHLLAQLENVAEIQKKRERLWKRYHSLLASWATEINVKTPYVPDGCVPSYHIYYLVFSSEIVKNAFVDYLREYGVGAYSHYQPLNTSIAARKYGYEDSCPVAEKVAPALVRLPLNNNLSDNDIDYLVDIIIKFRK